MDNEEHDLNFQAKSGAGGLHLRFPGESAAVRQALQTAMAAIREMNIGGSSCGVIEIVLAEVLNNVVEHAYADQSCGDIEVDVKHAGCALLFWIRDDGVQMPEGDAPEGLAQDIDVAAEDLPEGGFGWFLIRELTEDLAYARIGDRNELTFRIVLNEPAETF